jgi:hypothetical protein
VLHEVLHVTGYQVYFVLQQQLSTYLQNSMCKVTTFCTRQLFIGAESEAIDTEISSGGCTQELLSKSAWVAKGKQRVPTW